MEKRFAYVRQETYHNYVEYIKNMETGEFLKTTDSRGCLTSKNVKGLEMKEKKGHVDIESLVEYLNSRGFTEEEAVNYLNDNFITYNYLLERDIPFIANKKLDK